MIATRWPDQRVHLKTVVPGPRSRALRAREDLHLATGVQGYAVTSGIAVDHAEGSAITDVDGNVLLDFIGGIGVNALGHAHPVLGRALGEQLARVSVGSLTTEARVELTERLAAHAPSPGVDRIQLYSSGAEAVESALRLAKSHTGKSELVSFWGGFHGKTLGALALMGSSFKRGLGPMPPGTHLVPYADCYRCPLALEHPSCGLACVDVARKHLAQSLTGGVAAIVIEPMQGTAGNVIPPDDFMPAVRALADDLDALFVVDEMITGFGRTGRWWGTDHSKTRPDIVTIGKAFGGGFPVTGVLTTKEIASAKPWSSPSGSSSSYGGNPLAAAAAATATAHPGRRAARRERAARRRSAPRDASPLRGRLPVRGRGARARHVPRHRARPGQTLEGAAPGADRAADVRRVRGAGTPHHGLFPARPTATVPDDGRGHGGKRRRDPPRGLHPRAGRGLDGHVRRP